jgi:hypothetical protein
MAATESKVEEFAEELGKLLGSAEAKAKSWLGQRGQIAKTLEGIRDTATRLLTELGQDGKAVVQRGRRGRPPGSKNKPVIAKKRRTMSPEARAKIAAAQKKRWAKQKAAEKK